MEFHLGTGLSTTCEMETSWRKVSKRPRKKCYNCYNGWCRHALCLIFMSSVHALRKSLLGCLSNIPWKKLQALGKTGWGGHKELGCWLEWQRVSQGPAFLKPSATVVDATKPAVMGEKGCQMSVCLKHSRRSTSISRNDWLMLYQSYMEEGGSRESKILKQWSWCHSRW